jgi:hypothetical protein
MVTRAQLFTALNHTLCKNTNYVVSECGCEDCKFAQKNIRELLKKIKPTRSEEVA